MQGQAGVQTEAARISNSIHSTIPLPAQTFLHEQRMIVIGAVDPEDRVWASVLTGEPGFLKTPDEQTVEISATPHPFDPLSQNLHVGGAIGMIAIDFATRRRMRVNGWVKGKQGTLVVHTEQVYANCPKYIQARALLSEKTDEHSPNVPHAQQHVPRAEPRAQAPSQVVRKEALTSEQQAWIGSADTFFIASSNTAGGADASHRGGRPGFVQVEHASRLIFPDYSGNRMFQTLGNISAEPHAGLLFLDFERGDSLQLTGEAQIIWDGERVAAVAGAERLVVFTVEEVLEVKGACPLHWQLIAYSPFLPAART